MNTPSLHIRLFGLLEITWGDQPLSAPRSAQTRSLLAFLIVHHDRAFARDVLAGTFWPDRPDDLTRRALSNALWQIRQSLGPAAGRLSTEDNAVAFNLHPPDWLDVAAFENTIRHYTHETATDLPACLVALDKAVALYRGDLLEECYDDWTLVERERLRELYLNALERLVNLYKRGTAYERALACAQKLTVADPLREAAHREVMRLYHLLERDRAALQQYAILQYHLQEELGIQPTAATMALYHEIVTTMASPGPIYLPTAPLPPALRDVTRLPLIGRNKERAQLLEAVQAAAQGHGGLALIEGEAGVGKTRLLEEIAAGARWRGMQVGLGRAAPDTAIPYQPLVNALSPLLTPLRITQLDQLIEPLWLSAVIPLFPSIAKYLPDLPGPVPLDSRQEQQRLWEGLTQCLTGLASVAPLLLILEDLHWADEATLTVLPYLAPHLPANRVLLVLICRSAEARERTTVWESLESLDRSCSLLRLRLRPFERPETTTLLQRALGAGETDTQAETFARRLQDETAGNALFVVENLKLLLEQGALAPLPDGGWAFPASDLPLPLPASVQELIGKRLARLSPGLRALLEHVAVSAGDASFEILSRSSTIEPAALLATLEQLKQRGFLIETETRYRFEHDRVRELVYQLIPLQRRQALHRLVAATLERLRPDQVEILAHHFEHGQVWGKAVHYHQQTGERAARLYAYPAALHHYDRAIDLAETVHLPASQYFDLLAAREAILNVLGQRQEQSADLETMAWLAQDTPHSMIQVYQRQAWLLLRTSHYREAETTTRQALALAQQLEDVAQQAAALTVLGTAVHQRGDMRQAIPTLEAAIALYRELGDLGGEAQAHRALAAAFHGTGAYAKAREAVTTALSLYQTWDDKVGRAEGLNQFGAIHMEQGDPDQAIACYRQALEICHAIGYRYEEAKTLLNLGNVCYFQGQLAQALHYYDQASTVFTRIGERRGEAFVRANAATVRHTMLGDDETATRDAQAALAFYTQVGDRAGEGQCLDTLGGVALRQGQPETARKQWEAGLAAMQAAGDRWGEISLHRSLIKLALQEGRPQLALENLAVATALCQDLALNDRATALQADHGAILLALGQVKAALTATTQAMAQLRPGVERAYQIPFVHHQVLRAVGQNSEAQTAIAQAHHMLSDALQGLSPDQRRISLERVPEHRAIVAAYESTRPARVTLRLPCAGAPIGRPLRDGEWILVTWTVDAPEDKKISGKVDRRQKRLLRLLCEATEQNAAPTVTDLATALDVTPRTIKRDLAALRAAGHTVHTRGSR